MYTADQQNQGNAQLWCLKEQLDMVHAALQEEVTGVEYLKQLMNTALCPESKEIIRQIRLVEQKHVRLLAQLYTQLAGEAPQVAPESMRVNKRPAADYERCIFASLETANYYRKMMGGFAQPEIKDMFFDMLLDEQSHSVQFTFLYASTKGECPRM